MFQDLVKDRVGFNLAKSFGVSDVGNNNLRRIVFLDGSKEDVSECIMAVAHCWMLSMPSMRTSSVPSTSLPTN